MNITLRLYRMHDLDLMMLKYHSNANFPLIITTTLRAFCKKELFVIDLSHLTDFSVPKELPYRASQIIRLDEEKDKDLISFLKSIKDGYQNSFIKNVVRLYLSTYLLAQYPETYREFPVLATEVKQCKKRKKIAVKNIEFKTTEKESEKSDKEAVVQKEVIIQEVPKKVPVTTVEDVQVIKSSIVKTDSEIKVQEKSEISSPFQQDYLTVQNEKTVISTSEQQEPDGEDGFRYMMSLMQ